MEWIKINDKLPPVPQSAFGDQYLVTTDNGQVVAARYVQTTVRGKEVVRWEWKGKICPWKVIAYMPFPPPFQGEPE